MQPVAPPPVNNSVDLITASLQAASNRIFLQFRDIVGGIAFVAWFVGKPIANGVRQAFRHHGPVDRGGVMASPTFGLVGRPGAGDRHG